MKAAHRRWAERLARAGYAARGFVYVSIGVFAMLAAMDLTPEAGGNADVTAMLAGWPFGRVWLGVVLVGLLGFALWRVLQSAFDADLQGSEPKALASRAGQALSGLTYGLLALSVYRVLRHADEQASGELEAGAARVLGLPLGGVLLVLAGLFVAGVVVGGFLKAAKGDFCEQLSCSARVGKAATWVGRVGYAGRGLAFLPVAFFLVEAGLDENAARVRSLADSLQSLERQPMGSALLAFVGVGLIAFGGYAFFEAAYRRIRVPDAGGLG